jgi:hypothetical protein
MIQKEFGVIQGLDALAVSAGRVAACRSFHHPVIGLTASWYLEEFKAHECDIAVRFWSLAISGANSGYVCSFGEPRPGVAWLY